MAESSVYSEMYDEIEGCTDDEVVVAVLPEEVV